MYTVLEVCTVGQTIIIYLELVSTNNSYLYVNTNMYVYIYSYVLNNNNLYKYNGKQSQTHFFVCVKSYNVCLFFYLYNNSIIVNVQINP